MKKSVLLTLVFALALGIGATFYYFSLPKNAREQLEYAQSLENDFSQSKGDLTPESRDAFKEKVLKAYQQVETFPQDVFYDDALYGIGKFHKQNEDLPLALEVFLDFEKRFEKSELLEKVREEIIFLYSTLEKWKELLEYYEKFVQAHPKSPLKVDYLFHSAKIIKNNLPQSPPIKKINAFKRVVEVEKQEISDPFSRKYSPECLWEIALIYESISEEREAVPFLEELVKDYPNSEYTTKALLKKGRLLAEKLERPEEGKKDLEELKRQHPESKEAREAGGDIRKIEKDQNQEKGEEIGKQQNNKQKKYLRDYYGGSGDQYDVTQEMIRSLKDSQFPALGELVAQKLDILHYDGKIKISPKQHALEAQFQISLQNQGDAKKEVLLILSPNVSLEKVLFQGTPLTFQHAKDGRLKVVLSQSFEKEQTLLLEFHTLLITTTPGKVILGTDAGTGIMDSFWYPMTFLGDLLTSKITFQIPSDFRAVTNGLFKGEELKKIKEKEEKDGVEKEVEQEWRFMSYESTQPIFGIYFVYGRFQVLEDRWENIPLRLLYKNPKFTQAQKMLDTLKEILSFYASKFHPFPYESMTVIEAPLPFGIGGIGPATLMLLTEKSFEENAVIPESLMAHEAAHQWWGNLVPISFEQQESDYSQWLSEGFASYSDAMFLEKKHGRTRLINHLLKYGVFYFEQASERHIRDIAISKNFGSPSYVSVIYMKGACVLHALRWVLGDENFDKALATFAKTYAFKPSSIHAFRKICESYYGEDLYWFFKEWVDSPAIRIMYSPPSKKKKHPFQKKPPKKKKILRKNGIISSPFYKDRTL
jgi:outer membrane protein assembly factor BamD (BamD/ComL family)